MRAEDRPTRPWRVTPAGIAAAFVVALVCFLLAPAGLLIAAPFAHAMLALQTGGPAVLFGLGGALVALLGLAAAARMASPRAG